MFPYKTLRLIYPPRPSASIPSTRMKEFQSWWAQRKFNGTRTTVYVSPDREVTLKTRHLTDHKGYSMLPSMMEALRDLAPKDQWTVFDGEVMHNKTTGVKNRLVLFDLLVHESKHLIGTTYEQREKLLNEICGSPQKQETETGKGIALQVAEPIWLAETFKSNWTERYMEAYAMDELEGLVLKDPTIRLSPGVRENNNGDWLVRVRKPHKNYRY